MSRCRHGARIRLDPPGEPFRQRRSELKLSPTQLETLRRHASTGARRAAERLRDDLLLRAGGRPRSEPALAVVDLRSLALSEFPHGAPIPVGDDHAAVVAPLRGPLPGTGLLALEPHDALRWIRASGAGPEPLASFVEMGGCVLREVAVAIAGAFGAAAEAGRGELREGPIVGLALGTHAPPDTALLCARLAVAFEDDDVGEGRSLPAFLYLLLEAKPLAALLPALEPR